MRGDLLFLVPRLPFSAAQSRIATFYLLRLLFWQAQLHFAGGSAFSGAETAFFGGSVAGCYFFSAEPAFLAGSALLCGVIYFLNVSAHAIKLKLVAIPAKARLLVEGFGFSFGFGFGFGLEFRFMFSFSFKSGLRLKAAGAESLGSEFALRFARRLEFHFKLLFQLKAIPRGASASRSGCFFLLSQEKRSSSLSHPTSLVTHTLRLL
ncbi:hypothetical protein [Paenibacillus alba]|uniref:Uncharacterized protein n=1 Tax=Paenibacillus alba TaxID=1197127 RepID=A0ABU6G0H3_9BACL|nr:hypothetical protein [Paenibacillus alba]MEC0227144.1 hypothetical protein [Paenibacillus alba]